MAVSVNKREMEILDLDFLPKTQVVLTSKSSRVEERTTYDEVLKDLLMRLGFCFFFTRYLNSGLLLDSTLN